MMRSPRTACSPAITAAYAPTPGTTRPSQASAASKSAVTSTSAPVRRSALVAEAMFPEP